MNNIKTMCSVAMIVCLGGSASAQTWLEQRGDGAAYLDVSRPLAFGGNEVGSFFVDTGLGTGGSVLSWRITAPFNGFTNPAMGQNPVYVSLPVELPGAIIAGAQESFFVVAGAVATTGHGVMALLVRSGDALGTRSITFLGQRDYGPLFDPVGGAWNVNDGFLYVADYRSGQLFAAPWDGLTVPPPLTSFLPIVTVDGISVMEFESLSTGGVVLTQPMHLGSRQTTVVPGPGGGWSVTSSSYSAGLTTSLAVHNLSYLAAREDMYLKPATSGTLTVADADTGVVFYTAPVVVPGEWQAVPGSILQENRRYRVSLNGDLSQAIITPFLRWADVSSNATVSNVVCGRGDLAWPGPQLGNADFHVAGWVQLKQTLGVPPETVFVVLLLGLDNGSPVISTVGGLTQMAQPLVIAGPWPFTLTETSPSASFLYDHPIPGDPSLVGLTPLYQWGAVMTTGEMSASDIFGSTLFQ